MKKILLMAMVAFAFMACEGGNGAEMSSKEKKAVDAATVSAVSQIGNSPAAVDKALTAAGYKKADASVANAPKRIKSAYMKAAAATTEVIYLYGIEPKDLELAEKDQIAKQNQILAAGNSVIIVYAIFVDDKLAMMETNVIAPKKEKINQNYATTSDNFYAQIPANAQQSQWMGMIAQNRYEDHAKFIAAVVAAQAIEAQESALVLMSANQQTEEYDGYAYAAMLQNPDEDEVKAIEKDGMTPYVLMTYGVVDLNYYLEMM